MDLFRAYTLLPLFIMYYENDHKYIRNTIYVTKLLITLLSYFIFTRIVLNILYIIRLFINSDLLPIIIETFNIFGISIILILSYKYK
ncbi:unknown similar to AMEV163 [Mythimna separata entomopoxvirus 'L']|uniref:Uncharacterized protein n=1 Tax=Mythimna separata entomopoxvirus 'L' TaxID=1293572 RepID=A0A916P1K8_9POXV|nr:unknown similar to AMEV163 [Mythimna separata entomopoxvirus 'L']CCU56397.1 unknown similar to AMEV163 [Mythimna separata entomopoxvirus 'L']